MQAFGSTASIETAYYLKTGKPLLLSEQNLMDCAWDYGNTGCLGGFQALAYNYMHDKLEIASEEVILHPFCLSSCAWLSGSSPLGCFSCWLLYWCIRACSCALWELREKQICLRCGSCLCSHTPMRESQITARRTGARP